MLPAAEVGEKSIVLRKLCGMFICFSEHMYSP